MTGTIDQFYEHVLSLNPNYDNDFKDIIAADDQKWAALDPDDEDASTLVKRYKNVHCTSHDATGGQAERSGIAAMIDHLHKVAAACRAPAKSCNGLGCRKDTIDGSHDSKVALCNKVSTSWKPP